jgi:hypothetical protein
LAASAVVFFGDGAGLLVQGRSEVRGRGGTVVVGAGEIHQQPDAATDSGTPRAREGTGHRQRSGVSETELVGHARRCHTEEGSLAADTARCARPRPGLGVIA